MLTLIFVDLLSVQGTTGGMIFQRKKFNSLNLFDPGFDQIFEVRFDFISCYSKNKKKKIKIMYDIQ